MAMVFDRTERATSIEEADADSNRKCVGGGWVFRTFLRKSAGVMLVALFAVLGVAWSAAAAPKHGHVDPSFGKAGRTLSPVPPPPEEELSSEVTFGMAAGPRGELYVFDGGVIAAYSARGVPNRRFGEGGYLYPEPGVRLVPLGLGLEAETLPGLTVADIAVDSRGRIVVAGITRAAIPGVGYRDGSLATVLRYLPDGRPDPSFGSDGAVTSTLGLPLLLSWQEYGTTFYVQPAIKVTGLEIDTHDRPVLTGSARTVLTSCDAAPFLESEGFVARLTPAGTLDPEFRGGGGELVGGSGSTLLRPAIRNGRIAAAVAVDRCRSPHQQALVKFSQNGDPDPSFGAGGLSSVAFGSVAALALDSSKRILVLGERPREEWLGEGNGPFRKLARILPSGAADPAFRKRGSAEVPSSGDFSALAVDGRDRPLLAGWSTVGGNAAYRRFAVERMTRAGKVDRNFGDDGLVTIGFGRKADAEGRAILVEGRGRLVVAGFVFGAHGIADSTSFGLVRYIPTSGA